ncbi:ABC transporter, ATP-binding protein [Methanosarcina sp. WWM596]|nr:ABC transporter, ATP-binding protein [Methanosarcina sp. WWM596]AKB22123.1 ABC transporter, ATP-binding protein [Methanosarcina sp. WH1]
MKKGLSKCRIKNLGPNDSGKTTIIKMLTGQIKPNSDTLKLHGINVLEDPLRVRELGGVSCSIYPKTLIRVPFITFQAFPFSLFHPKTSSCFQVF